MQTLIKRLEVIKNAIALGDDELIPMQLAKLPASEDSRVVAIVQALQQERYSEAVILIEDLVMRSHGLVVYEDVAVAGLKLELKSLEAKLLQLNEQKITTQQVLGEFRSQYHLVVGSAIQAVLDWRYKISYQQTLIQRKAHEQLRAAKAVVEEKIETLKAKVKELQQSALDDEQLDTLRETLDALAEEKQQFQQAQEALDKFEADLATDTAYQDYQEAKEDKETFEEEIEEIIEQHEHELPEEQKKRLKTAYRKAAKLCHPDTVADDLKEQAHQIMTELNIAYDKQNLTEVERILALLESGAGFVTGSDSIQDSEQLKGKIADLRHSIAKLEAEIEKLMQDDTYQTIEQLDDWQAYFESIKTQLQTQAQSLEQAYQALLDEEEQPTLASTPAPKKSVTEDNYWFSEF